MRKIIDILNKTVTRQNDTLAFGPNVEYCGIMPTPKRRQRNRNDQKKSSLPQNPKDITFRDQFPNECPFTLYQARKVENTGGDYLRNLEIEEAIYRSAEEKRQIAL